jgi:acyl carrier protein
MALTTTRRRDLHMSATITSEQVENVIVEAITRFGTPAASITRDAKFEQLDVDSLDLVELAQIVEDEFGVKIANDDLAGLQSVGDAIDYVLAKAS